MHPYLIYSCNKKDLEVLTLTLHIGGMWGTGKQLIINLTNTAVNIKKLLYIKRL